MVLLDRMKAHITQRIWDRERERGRERESVIKKKGRD